MNIVRRSADIVNNQGQDIIEYSLHTKGDNVKYLDCLVVPCGCETSAIGADAGAVDSSSMSTKLLHELYANGNFLPELDHPVDRACYQKVGMRCYGYKRELVLVHQRFRVARGDWQGVDIELLVR